MGHDRTCNFFFYFLRNSSIIYSYVLRISSKFCYIILHFESSSEMIRSLLLISYSNRVTFFIKSYFIFSTICEMFCSLSSVLPWISGESAISYCPNYFELLQLISGSCCFSRKFYDSSSY